MVTSMALYTCTSEAKVVVKVALVQTSGIFVCRFANIYG